MLTIPEGTPVNYYLLHGEKNNPYLKATEWNWQIDPLGFPHHHHPLRQRLADAGIPD